MDQLETTRLDEEVGFRLRLAQLAVFSDIIEGLREYDLRPVDLSALLLIEAQPGLRQHIIGDRLKMARPNVVALIDSLESRGLVDRTVDEGDRRANQLHLTRGGQALLAKGKSVQDAHRVRVLAALDGFDYDNFMAALAALAQLGKAS